MPDTSSDQAREETSDKRVVVYFQPSLLAEVDRRVGVTNKTDPDRDYGRGTFIKSCVREYLRRHPT